MRIEILLDRRDEQAEHEAHWQREEDERVKLEAELVANLPTASEVPDAPR